MLARLCILIALVGCTSIAPEPGTPSSPAVVPLADGSRPPNLLLILLDDWGIDRFDGHPTQPDTSARTPVLDALAARGLVFTRAYADPLCSPSRAALISGRYGAETGVTAVFTFHGSGAATTALETPGYDTLPQALRRRGYANHLVGKWHLTGRTSGISRHTRTSLESPVDDPYMHPIRSGFDSHVGVIANLPPSGEAYTNYELARATADGARQEDVVDGTYVTTREVDDVLARIDAAGDRPWFTFLSLSAPHRPWPKPPQDLVSVDLDDLSPRDQPALYEAVLEAADTEIGRLLASIDPRVLAETVVVVTADNGTPGAAFADRRTGRAKKGTQNDGGTHVPLIVSAPFVTPGRSDQLVHLVDLYATLIELAGGTSTSPHSVSFAPRLRGERGAEREWVYCLRRKPMGFPEGGYDLEQRLVRNDEWILSARTVKGGPLKTDLRFIGDALWGEGEPVDPSDPRAAAAYEELLGIMRDVEAGGRD